MKKLILGRSEEKLLLLPDNSIDAVSTDPPYGLKFMNKKWDYAVPSVALWQEVLRVLKPGGYLLSFGGTRTYHRMVVNIEDAGFEIRDCIMWIYGSGFPKSMDIGKAFDKSLSMERTVIGTAGYSAPDIRGNSFNDDKVADRIRIACNITAPASDLAKQWDGWGTALKPANEPIVLARKPLIGTVVENIMEHGVGGINIDGCRVGEHKYSQDEWSKKELARKTGNTFGRHIGSSTPLPRGRFPANIILDEDAGRMLDEQTGVLTSGNAKEFRGEYSASVYGKYAYNQISTDTIYADSGGASRFFYCAKSSKAERNAGLQDIRQNTHPTVKPIKLMQYLIRLITPPDGIVLDPFAGSGTTGIACIKEQKHFVLIEQDEESYNIAKARLKSFIQKQKNKVT